MSAIQGEKECLNKAHADALKKYAYDQKFWERQVKASKGFEWSKKMLGEMMSWASKFDDEEVIECALNKVDLPRPERPTTAIVWPVDSMPSLTMFFSMRVISFKIGFVLS